MALLKSEVDIYLRLDHPNIARLHEVYEDDKCVHIVMEYCRGKELYHRLVSKEDQHFSESFASGDMFAHFFSGILYRHPSILTNMSRSEP
mmetsp:Transcript_14116/g.12081  ORF Transcript_14116/g.12081 Transcript_14116/m.12081 type:complete len:90 (-) Transcript_14116:230-499(-)